jgi:hypothetical protein
MTPRELQELLEELTASRASRLRAWQCLQEIRWVIKDTTGMDLPPPPRKTIDAEGTVIVQGIAKAVREHRAALADLLRVARALRHATDHPSEPGYPQVLHELHQVMDRVDRLVQW